MFGRVAVLMMLSSVSLMTDVVLDLKNLYLPEFSRNSNQAMIGFNVINMNVQDIWIEFAFAIGEKAGRRIIYFHFEALSWIIF